MRSLNDLIILKVNSGGYNTGYHNAFIYADGIGVFSGHSYVSWSGEDIEYSLNELISQNRNKYDYLKLNNDGVLTSNEIRFPLEPSYLEFSNFEPGLMKTYSVSLQGDSSVQFNTASETVLTCYDYQNEDLRPNIGYPSPIGTFLARAMSGCYWVYNPSTNEASFDHLLMPHYPAIDTSKYGVGLQIQDVNNDYYAIRSRLGFQYRIGAPYTNKKSAQAFVTLYDLMNDLIELEDDEDTPLYLKHEDNPSNGDAFGQLINGYDEYIGMVWVKEVEVVLQDGNEIISVDTYNMENSEEEYQKVVNYMYRYLLVAPEIEFDFDSFLAEDPAYTTFGNADQVEAAMSDYVDLFVEKKLVGKDQGYDVYIEPMPEYDAEFNRYIPTHYIGKCPIAILDHCYKRYYLAWTDRYGDIMSQPFEGKIKYNEDVKTEEISDWLLRRKVSQKTIQPKWTLNSGWINEKVYPIYESIFTSPYLLLYDTKQDKAWNVILTTNNYTEKTYKNEKGLLNLEITVEANTKENNIF